MFHDVAVISFGANGMLGRGAHDTRSTLSKPVGNLFPVQLYCSIKMWLQESLLQGRVHHDTGSRPSHLLSCSATTQMPEPPSTKPPSASYLSRIRRSFGRSSPGVSPLSELASTLSMPFAQPPCPRCHRTRRAGRQGAGLQASVRRAGRQADGRAAAPSLLPAGQGGGEGASCVEGTNRLEGTGNHPGAIRTA